MLKYLLPLCLLASPCLAQQQSVTPAEAALQINNMVNQMAMGMANQGHVIGDLQKQIAAKDVRIKELETKTEPKKE